MFPMSNTATAVQKSPTMSSRLEPVSTPKSIAEGIFEELRANGLRDKDIIAVSSQILSLLTEEIKVRFAENKSPIA